MKFITGIFPNKQHFEFLIMSKVYTIGTKDIANYSLQKLVNILLIFITYIA